MLIKTLELKNFCQHRHLTIDFNNGLTAIVGPNGCGKSNVLTAIRYAFTGDIASAGKKDQNICQFANKSSKSYVRVVFSHGDVEAEIVRYLRPSSAKDVMTYSDGVSIHGAIKINAALEDLIGEAYNLLSDIVIVSQGDIFGFLTRTPAKRAEFFQNLFKVARAKQIYNYLGKYLAENPEKVLSDDYETMEFNLAETKKAKKEQEERLHKLEAEYGTVKELDKRISNGLAVIQIKNLQNLLVEEIADTIKKEEDLNIQISALVDKIKSTKQTVASIERFLSDRQEEYKSAKDQLVIYKTAQAEVARVRQVLKTIKETEDRISEFEKEYITVKDVSSLDSISKKVEEILEQYNPLKNLLDKLSNIKDSSVCPTCGQSLDAVLSQREELQIKFNTLHSAYESARAEYKKLETQKNKKISLEQQIETNKQVLASLKKNVESSAVDGAVLSIDVSEINKFVAEYEDCLKQGHRWDSELIKSNQTLQFLKSNLETLLANKAALNSKLLDIKATNKSVDELQALLDSLKSKKVELEVFVEEVKKLKWQADSLKQNIDKYKQDTKKIEKYNNWRRFVSDLRDVFHKDAAPKVYAIKYLKNIESVINNYLEVFESDFRVETDESLSFTAKFLDGRVQDATRLSGGQSVTLALAFRLAINFIFAENLGFLALDEPTAYLDEHHIAGFEPVLNNLRLMTNSREIQLIIVTHESRLSSLFDNVIELD